ncbi:Mobile element protein [Marinilactibacillus psychrotolerans 42ea]|uniref:Mobile element protein n=6 Tax=Marinilactibacillus psychrotolerans TaxID=191770 RepID=A0A1R4J0M6_9LACT|nr:Mobile element protein [Marinilactibacillus psychrotolerans 42ea]
MKRIGTEDHDLPLKELITDVFYQAKERYGYKRITDKLNNVGIVINHKKVYSLMKELGLKCSKFTRKTRKYNSYKGTVGKVAKNKLNRRFNTSIPLQKLVTDITEFKCTKDQKLYFNPILDLYNGEIISYSINKRPILDLVISPLKEAIKKIEHKGTVRTTIHSDQGWHYQHKKWVDLLKQNKIFQSMSRKATCSDNAVIENFFGIMKQEMYHGEPTVSYEELKKQIEEYIEWYNTARGKKKLAGLSPVEYRTQASQSAA